MRALHLYCEIYTYLLMLLEGLFYIIILIYKVLSCLLRLSAEVYIPLKKDTINCELTAGAQELLSRELHFKKSFVISHAYDHDLF